MNKYVKNSVSSGISLTNKKNMHISNDEMFYKLYNLISVKFLKLK